MNAVIAMPAMVTIATPPTAPPTIGPMFFCVTRVNNGSLYTIELFEAGGENTSGCNDGLVLMSVFVFIDVITGPGIKSAAPPAVYATTWVLA